jgi:digeranylgeranylglycerophospholipid reductase
VGAEIECEPIAKVDPRFLHCFADSRLAPGYIGWVVPGHGTTQIGIAARHRRKPDLEAFIARARERFGFNRLHVVQRRSGLIPTGGPVAPLGRGRVLLIGDAAGLVSPLTGGGIHTALSFGRRAAQLVSDYLLDRGPSPAPAFAGRGPALRTEAAAARRIRSCTAEFCLQRDADDAPDAGAGAAHLFPSPRRRRGFFRNVVGSVGA